MRLFKCCLEGAGSFLPCPVDVTSCLRPANVIFCSTLQSFSPLERRGKERAEGESGERAIRSICGTQCVPSAVKGNISTLRLHPSPMCSQAEPGSCCALLAWRPVRSTQTPGPRLNRGDAEGTCISCQSSSVSIVKALVGQQHSDGFLESCTS